MEFLNFNSALWAKEIKKLQLHSEIYPEKAANERTYCRVARLLTDLFATIVGTVPENLENDFYLLGKKWNLYCKRFPDDQESKVLSMGYLGYDKWLTVEDHFYPEFQKQTRIILGLTKRLIGEVGNEGVDGKKMIEFLSFLYQHCAPGFLCIVDGPVSEGQHSFFSTRNGFKEVPLAVTRYLREWQRSSDPEGSFKSYYFYFALIHRDNTISIPALFVDIDRNIPEFEDRIDHFKIRPSIQAKTSPRGQHLFWILRKPAGMNDWFRIMEIEDCLGQLLGGDPDPFLVSRLPGTFNKGYYPNHFVDYQIFPPEYTLDDFDHLPRPKFSHRRTIQLAALWATLNALLHYRERK